MSGIVDVHAHLGRVMHAFPPLTVEGLLRFMDRHGIELSVVLPLVNPEEVDYPYTTEDALRDCARHPDRLIPFANVDPRRGSNDGEYDFTPVLKRYTELGCRGFGEMLCNLPANDPRMKGLYRACGKLGLPMIPALGSTLLMCRATSAQAARTTDVDRAMHDIAAVVEENAASAEETAAAAQQQTACMEEISSSAQDLADMAHRLEESVHMFRLAEGTSWTES